MPRRRYIAIAAIACGVVAGYVAWRAIPHDEVSPVAVGEAVRIFRQRAVGALAARPGEPEPGVYRYSTRGGESVDAALGILSSSHDYPGNSTLSVIPNRCGMIERWQVLVTRWTEEVSCRAPGGYRLVSIDELHEFVGVRREVLYRCREPVRPGPPRLRPGMEWRGHCETDDSSRESRFRVLGMEGVRVGERSFEAVHTRTELRLLGNYSGSAIEEDWRRRSDGLLLRRRSLTDASSSGTLSADYTERYEIELRSVRPDR
ncbi:MAG TPA: hypothetical protein VFZ41_03480 [Solirubrobacterales bacterium]